jgi:hypothetical protein
MTFQANLRPVPLNHVSGSGSATSRSRGHRPHLG